jgi:thiamine pyrophosphokinase
LVGVTGDRLDHTFGSLGILVKYARSVDICLVDDIGVAYPVSHELIVDDALGRTVSLMPMGFVGRVRTTGLKWPLLDEDMDVGVRDGTSNLAVLNTVTVTVGSGVLVAYVHHRR